MNEQRDLSATLVCATILLLSLVYLAQCSTHAPAPEPGSRINAAAEATHATSAEPPERGNAAQHGDDEESVKVKNIGHALQTVGADPVLRKTYGVEH